MTTSELLEAKHQAQRRLDKQAGHDLRTYAKNMHEIVQAIEKKYGLKFRYESVQVSPSTSATPAGSSHSPSHPALTHLPGEMTTDREIHDNDTLTD
jgi:hypothetical protein